MKFLENPSFKQYFLVVLSKQRTKGRFKRTESLVRDLADLLSKILDLAEKEKDYTSAKNCIILSQTYYYDENEKIDDKKKKEKQTEGKKIYLFELIKNNRWLTSLEFWDGLIEYMVDMDIKKNEEAAISQGLTNNEKTKKNRMSNICFSQLLTYTSNMIEFGLSKTDVESMVVKYSEKYEVAKELIDTINANIEMKVEQVGGPIKEIKIVEEKKEVKENKESDKNNVKTEENIIKKKVDIKNKNLITSGNPPPKIKNISITGNNSGKKIIENILELKNKQRNIENSFNIEYTLPKFKVNIIITKI